MVTKVAATALLLALGCAPAKSDQASLRSPSYDYPPPAQVTANGETVGADNQRPEDKLESGLRVGREGPIAPGWSFENGKPKYSSEKVKGGRTSEGSAEDKSPDGGPAR